MINRDRAPAFPEPEHFDQLRGEKTYFKSGMTLRDVFADSAMREMLARIKYSPDRYAAVAYESYQMADAMLKARNADAQD